MEPESKGSDAVPTKKLPIEDLSKDELLKKFKSVLLIAQKAKQSKDESLEEIKRLKESELQLKSNNEALQEMVSSLTAKQAESAEYKNKVTILSKKQEELKKNMVNLEEKNAKQILENVTLKETLKKLTNKISEMEISHGNALEEEKQKKNILEVKLKTVCDDLEGKDLELVELKQNFQKSEEKYKNLESTLNTFETKYKEESEKFDQLNETLKKLKERPSSRNSDTLKPVSENLEYENLQEKFQELVKELDNVKLENEKLTNELNTAQAIKDELKNKFCSEIDQLSAKANSQLLSAEAYDAEIEKLKHLLETKNIEIQILTQNNQDYEAKFQVLNMKFENDLKSISENDKKLCLQLEETSEGIDERSKQISDLKIKLEVLEKELGDLTVMLDDAMNKINKYENNELLELKNLQKQILEFRELEETFELTRNQQKNIIKQLQSEIEELKTNNENFNQLSETLDQSETKFKLLQTDYMQEKENSVKLNNLIIKLQEDITNLNKNLNETNFNSEKLIEKCDLLEENVKLEKSKNEELNLKLQKQEEETERYKHVENENEKLQFEVKELKTKLEELRVEIKEKEELMNEKQVKDKEDKELIENLDKLKEELHGKTVELEMCLLESNKLSEEMRFKNEKIDNFEIKLSELEFKLNNEISKCNSLTDNKVNSMKCLDGSLTLLKAIKNLFSDIKSTHNDYIQYVEELLKNSNVLSVVQHYVQKIQESNSELLNEMNDMNQALKQRGELISKLQEESVCKNKDLTDKENMIKKLEEETRDKDELKQKMLKLKSELDNKEIMLRDLEEEIWKLKNESTQNETLSSSTLSRVEEMNRMGDVEDTFEERYTKLKVIAVRLKKKVNDLSSQLEAEHDKVVQFQSQVKTLKNIQSECDRLQDELDEQQKQKGELKKQLSGLRDEYEKKNEMCEVLLAEKEKFNKEKQSLDIIKKELSGQVQSLKKEIDSVNVVRRQLERNEEELREDCARKDKQMEELTEKIKKLNEQLDALKIQSNKEKHSVLSLEIADYEKAVKELEMQIVYKDTRLKEMEDHLETQSEMTRSLEESRIELERSLHSSEDRVRDLTDRLDVTSAQLRQTKSSLEESVRCSEDRKLEMEGLLMQLGELSQEKQKGEEKSRASQEYLSRQIHMLEENLSNVREILEQREIEIGELRTEFESYKIRAQNVLRQSQKDVSVRKQQNVLEEMEQLKITSDTLKNRLEDTCNKLKFVSEENKNLLDEKTRLYVRVQELTGAVNELRSENLKLSDQQQKLTSEYEEKVKLNKVQQDTLVSCYLKQIQEIQDSWKTERERLLSELDEVKTKLEERVNVQAGAGAGDVLDVMLLEREEGEGSESVDSTSPKNPPGGTRGTSNMLLPLERLLNQVEVEPVMDMLTVREKLDKSENQVRHLSVLLSEAESDSARLKQQNDLLKDEIRRSERNAEREKHAHNLEYLKNVVLKFVSLQNVDEKLRLIPVLNTILTLSPDEHNLLTSAAKGEISEGAGTAKGWGSYLQLWAGSQ